MPRELIDLHPERGRLCAAQTLGKAHRRIAMAALEAIITAELLARQLRRQLRQSTAPHPSYQLLSYRPIIDRAAWPHTDDAGL